RRERGRGRLVEVDDLRLLRGGGEPPVVAEVPAGGDLRAVERDEARVEGPAALAVVGVPAGEGALDVPVGGGAERHPLPLALDDHPGGDRLDAPGGDAGADLAPEQRGDLVPDEAVEDPAGLLGV